MGNSREFFLKPIMAVTAAPRTEDVKTFVTAYANILDEFDDEILSRAAATMLRTQKIKTVPTPAECVDACRDAAKTIQLEKMRSSRARPRIPHQETWTEEEAKKADALFASAWGRRAVEDGVEIALWDFLVQQQRWPNGQEYEAIKTASKRRQAETSAFLKQQQESGGLKSMPKGWLGAMSSKAAKLRELVRSNAVG